MALYFTNNSVVTKATEDKHMYFDIHKNAQGQYWWVARGENNETLCASQMYRAKESAKHAIGVVKSGAASANVYDETGEVRGDVAARRILV